MKVSFTVSAAAAIGLIGVFAASTLSGRAAVQEQADPSITSQIQPMAFTPNASWEQCRLSRADYDKLSTGMGYPNVELMLGCPGRETSRQEIAGRFGSDSVSYQWRGVGNTLITARFQNNALTSKTGFGLK